MTIKSRMILVLTALSLLTALLLGATKTYANRFPPNPSNTAYHAGVAKGDKGKITIATTANCSQLNWHTWDLSHNPPNCSIGCQVMPLPPCFQVSAGKCECPNVEVRSTGGNCSTTDLEDVVWNLVE